MVRRSISFPSSSICPVRVGGDEPEASFSSNHEHSGELWCPRVVDKRRSYNLSQAVGKNGSGDFDPFLLRHSKTRDLGTNGNSDQKLGPSWPPTRHSSS